MLIDNWKRFFSIEHKILSVDFPSTGPELRLLELKAKSQTQTQTSDLTGFFLIKLYVACNAAYCFVSILCWRRVANNT